MTHAVIMKLVEPVAHRGYHVYMDNFYTSPQAFVDLCATGFGACGTLQLNRRGLPLVIKEAVRKGERKVVWLDPSMYAIKSTDKRLVTVLTTIQSGDDVVTIERRNQRAPGGQERVQKPQAVADYNKYMGTQQTSCCHTMALAIVRLDGGDEPSSFCFTWQLSTAMCGTVSSTLTRRGGSLMSSTAFSSHGRRSVSSHPVARLTERHFLTAIGRNETGWPLQQDCTVCSRRQGRGRHTSVGSAICPCVWYHVSNFTTQRGTHRGTFLTVERCEV